MSSKINKNKNYQSKLTKKLCYYLGLNSFLYLIFSTRFLNLNIDGITNIILSIKEVIGFNYSAKLFSIINFVLISFTSIKILFLARKIPIVLILTSLFILSIDNNIAELLFGDKGFYIGSYFSEFYSSDFIVNNFISNKYSLENLNYSIVVLLNLYSFIRIFFLDITEYAKPKYNSYYSGSSSYNRFDDNQCNQYNPYNHYNNPYRTKKFKIFSDFDKEQVYEKRFTNANDKVIDENGMERYVWEYANEYENEKRLEEDRKFQEEQNWYNDYYYNNDSYNYNPYSNDNSYGGNDWASNSYNNDSYYGGSGYNNDNGWF